MASAPPTTIAGYRILDVVGRGGMGVVYRAEDLELGRTVALKVVAPELASDTAFRARFVRETRVTAAIDHPNVVPVYAAGDADGVLFLAMRYVEGPALGELVPLAGDRAARIVSQVAAGVEAAHQLGLLHRDIKPANVLLDRSDHAYVCDFGIARLTPGPVAGGEASDFAGTLGFVSPEQLQGAVGDPRSDIYSLGCLLYVTLTGRAPFEYDTPGALVFAHLNEPVPLPSALRPELAPFDAIVAQAMAKQPDDRYHSALELVVALAPYRRDEAPATVVEAAPPVPEYVAPPAGAGWGAPPPPYYDAPSPPYGYGAPPPPSGFTASPTYIPPVTSALAPWAPPRRRGLTWPRIRLWRRSPATNGVPPPAPPLAPTTERLLAVRRRTAAVRLPLSPAFRYVHHPVDGSGRDALPLLGNEDAVLALVERIMHSDGGAFLLTGFRGVGKTTVTMHALEQLRLQLGEESIVPVFLNIARRKTTEELLFEVIRRLFEALVDGHVLEKLPLEIQRQLILAYTRTSLSFTQTHGSGSERARSLGFSVPVPMLDALGPKFELSSKSTNSLALEASFLAYSAADVEHDFLRIVSLFRRRGAPADQQWTGKVVIVIDELDKLTTTAEGRECLDELVSGLKNLLTTWGVHFVFIAGPDLHDLSRHHSHRGNSVYDSVFGWQLYVPCVWEATDRLLAELLPGSWARQPEFASLPEYLRFKARGVPRLLLMELNALVEWDEDGPCVTLRAADRKRIEFYADVERILAGFTGARDDGRPFAVAIDEDRWRIGAYYVTDWILRTLGRTFTVADVVRAGEDVELDPLLVLAPEKVQELLDHLTAHGIVVLVRGLGADERHFGDVPNAQVAVYKLADDAGAKLREFARDNVQERAELFAWGTGPEVAAQPWAQAAAGDVVGDGRYELEAEIDRGGMGRVYRARDRKLGRVVAVKMLDMPEVAGDEVMRARFQRKAGIALDLEHPNIAATLDTFTEDDRRLGIVSAFIEGTSLQQLLRQARLTPAQALTVADGLLAALEYLGGRGIVRLDLKPSSVMVEAGFKPVIIDLGLAKREATSAGDKPITESVELVGTPAYQAPEAMTSNRVDARADVYTVGLLTFEMIAGRAARPAGSLFEVLRAAQTQDVDTSGLDVSAELRAALDRMLARVVAARFETPAAARAALAATPESGS